MLSAWESAFQGKGLESRDTVLASEGKNMYLLYSVDLLLQKLFISQNHSTK
jgi:hypothetical protein